VVSQSTQDGVLSRTTFTLTMNRRMNLSMLLLLLSRLYSTAAAAYPAAAMAVVVVFLH
jgi:hypothetical protein